MLSLCSAETLHRLPHLDNLPCPRHRLVWMFAVQWYQLASVQSTFDNFRLETRSVVFRIIKILVHNRF